MIAGRKEIFFFGDRPSEYYFLDNFYPCEFVVDGIRYRSLEHWYQSHKTTDTTLRMWIIAAPNATEAKRRGRSLNPYQMRPDWEDIKVSVMREGMFYKFGRSMSDPNIRSMLMEAGDAVLHEDSPDDMFWGVKGADWAGRLLMETRNLLRLEQRYRS
jgi:ribA/ribD-fused uncharacterized protein